MVLHGGSPWQMSFFLLVLASLLSSSSSSSRSVSCGVKGAKKLLYVRGDALSDDPRCVGPDGRPYPIDEINSLLPRLDAKDRFFIPRGGSGRQARMMTMAEEEGETANSEESVRSMRMTLLRSVAGQPDIDPIEEAFSSSRRRREAKQDTAKTKAKEDNKVIIDADEAGKVACEDLLGPDKLTPSRLCKATYNTTAPMYGVSLTNGKPVTIVQKFPDLLQQVVFETCDTSECDLVHGECVQNYVPYLFLVIPLGPVTLTGQDYVLVESGCTCRPKYARQRDPDPLSVIPEF